MNTRNELKKVNRQLGQLRRRLIWNYDRVVELEQRKRDLEKEVTEQDRKNRAYNWIWKV